MYSNSHTSANQITFKAYYIIHWFFVDNRIYELTAFHKYSIFNRKYSIILYAIKAYHSMPCGGSPGIVCRPCFTLDFSLPIH